LAFIGIPAMLFFAFLTSAHGGTSKYLWVQLLLALMSVATIVEFAIFAAWVFALANDDRVLVVTWYVAIAVVVLPWLPSYVPRFRVGRRE
jgi:hypothetical protein